MKDTGYDLFGPIIPKRAAGYEKKGKSLRKCALSGHVDSVCGWVNVLHCRGFIPLGSGSVYRQAPVGQVESDHVYAVSGPAMPMAGA